MKRKRKQNVEKRLKTARKKINENDILYLSRHRDIENISENLKKLPELGKVLGMHPEEIILESINQKRYNLSYKKPFDYEPCSIFIHRYRTLKSCAKYIFVLEKLLSRNRKFYKLKINELRKSFRNSFSDFGLTQIFLDFCRNQKIEISEIEPKITNNKILDLKIKILDRYIYVELFSPIEAILRGTSHYEIIKREISKHKLENFSNPLIFVINTSAPGWCKNNFNRGYITDEMFFEIKKVYIEENEYKNFKTVSAFFIKHGEILRVILNKNANIKLTKLECNKLILKSKIKRILKYIWK